MGALAIALMLTVALAASAAAQAPASGTGISPYGLVTGDTSGVERLAAVDQATPGAVDPAATLKRGEFIVAPLPMVNPTLENGLAFVTGYLYRVDSHDAVTSTLGQRGRRLQDQQRQLGRRRPAEPSPLARQVPPAWRGGRRED